MRGPTLFLWVFFTILVFLFSGFSSGVIFAHEKHGEKDHHGGNGHHHACAAHVPKDRVDIPDFNKPNWRLVEKSERGSFRYLFFQDINRPEIGVVAMVVRARVPGTDTYMTRVSWQVGDTIRSVRVEVDEMVCENPIVKKDGKVYDLKELMTKLIDKK